MGERFMKIALMALTLINFKLFAASFLPIDVHERMKNSDLVIRGFYLGKSYKKLPTGQVVTEHTFSVKESAGIESNEIVNKNSFKVISPGGIWNGLQYKVTGAPKFVEGEDVVLMVSRGKFGLVFPDLAMSKFRVVNKLGKETLVSDIFSNKENIGRISYDDFKVMAESFYGGALKKFEADKFVYSKQEKVKTGRSLASSETSEVRAKSEGKKFSFFWLTVVLTVLGAYWTRQSSKKVNKR